MGGEGGDSLIPRLSPSLVGEPGNEAREGEAL